VSHMHDLVILERRDAVRVIVNIAGRFSLSDRRNARGDRRVFSCRAVNLSTTAIALVTSVAVKVGDRVIAHIDHLGKLEGSVLRLLDGGFVMSIAPREDEGERLRAKIEWLERHKNFDATEQRRAARFQPAKTFTNIVLPDGSVESCEILDLSITGVAISAKSLPAIGEVLAVGSVVGRVVRHFAGGFGVQFVQSQKPDGLEARVIRQ
jgi:hypothetical protein